MYVSLSGSPDIPQNFTAIQKRCPNSDICYAVASWQSPENNEAANVTGYIISVNGEDGDHVVPTQSSGNVFYTELILPSCGNNDISIIATNVCGGGLPANYTLDGNYETSASSHFCGTRSVTISQTTTAIITDKSGASLVKCKCNTWNSKTSTCTYSKITTKLTAIYEN